MKIKKAIIPAAGLGTRFLPATKALPKEMLPIVDKPAIQYIVEEAMASGIEDILIITGRNKRAIEDHFDRSVELEIALERKEKAGLLNLVKHISNIADIHYIRQKEPKGLGHAIHCAKSFIGDDPFAVLLGDDIVRSQKPCLKQLMEIYEIYNSTILGVQKVSGEEVKKYGIVKGRLVDGRIYEVKALVEKPQIHEAPSDIAIMGRYIITPGIFSILENISPGAGDEIQLTDALSELCKYQKVYSYEFEGRRYDVGDKLGYLQAIVEFALEREDLRKEFKENLMKLIFRLADDNSLSGVASAGA